MQYHSTSRYVINTLHMQLVYKYSIARFGLRSITVNVET